MSWKVIWRDRVGEEKRTTTPSLETAFIQAEHDQSRGLEVVRIEGPDGELISADEVRSWGLAQSSESFAWHVRA
jgi:hypothetical protein